MKTNHSISLGFAALIIAVMFTLAGCGSADGGPTGTADPALSGTITISPNSGVTTGDQLTANYSGTETVTYQWNKNGTAIATGGTNTTYTPSEAGNYTVTVSATDYQSKTSTGVTVTTPDPTLSGSITITPSGPVAIGTSLTATYSGGTETVTYQWNKDGTAIATGGTNATYTPSETAGSYTVTVSAASYQSKTSTAVRLLAIGDTGPGGYKRKRSL